MYGGLNGLALTTALSLSLEFIVNPTLTVRILEVGLAEFWRQSWRPLAAAAVTAAAVRGVCICACRPGDRDHPGHASR